MTRTIRAVLQFPIYEYGPYAGNANDIGNNYRHVMSWGANIPANVPTLGGNAGERFFFVGNLYNLYAYTEYVVGAAPCSPPIRARPLQTTACSAAATKRWRAAAAAHCPQMLDVLKRGPVEVRSQG
jgi:hypothetical protein